MKEEGKRFAEFVLYAVSMFVVIWMYTDSVQIPAYAAEICFFFYVVFFLMRRYTAYKRKQQLEEVCASEGNFSEEQLPVPQNQEEKLTQKILIQLRDQKHEMEREKKRQEQENNEYYTMWIHQIKTPIAALGLLIQSEEYGNRRSRMEQELFSIEQYAQMALHYLHLQEEDSDLVLKTCELSEIVRKSLRKYSVSFIEKHLSMTLDTFEREIVTDEKWMEILIEQLISNSVKYTVEGGVHIYLSDREELVIADTGIGIRTEDLPRIFERGFTGFNGRLDQHSTGIGLYLCRQIADRLGVRLNVTSEVGKGTQFYITLPQQEENDYSHDI